MNKADTDWMDRLVRTESGARYRVLKVMRYPVSTVLFCRNVADPADEFYTVSESVTPVDDGDDTDAPHPCPGGRVDG